MERGEKMFGLAKKWKTSDLLWIQTEGQKQNLYILSFPTVIAADLMQLLTRLMQSRLNCPETLGEWGGFTLLLHAQACEKIAVLAEHEPLAQPLSYQDFAHAIVRRLNEKLEKENGEEDEELIYFLGEFTLLSDGE
jgi:hypothetical protein